MNYLRAVLPAILLLACKCSLAQYAIDSVSLRDGVTRWYDQQVGLTNTILQHGELATLTRKSPNSHAYYESSTWRSAIINYRSQTFTDIPSIYNIEEDILVIQNNLGRSSASLPLVLQKELVSFFKIENSHFEYVNETVGQHQKGFYKIAYRGKVIVLLCKVFKMLDVRDGIVSYMQSHHYFVKKDNQYFRIKNLSGLISLFPDHKKEIRQYRKNLSIPKLDNPSYEDRLVQLIAYCDKF